MSLTPLLTTYATSLGGRDGRCSLEGGKFVLGMARPKEIAGSSAIEGMNPEQLFAMGYASCYGQAVNAMAKKSGIDAANASVVCEVTLNRDETGGFSLSVHLKVSAPGQEREKLRHAAEAAHEICPYSKATRGNIPVVITIV